MMTTGADDNMTADSTVIWRVGPPIPAEHVEALSDWVRDHGVEPEDVPAESGITVERVDGTEVIRHRLFVRDGGRLILDDVGVPRTREQTVPLWTPQPDGVGTWCGDPT